MGTVRPRIRAVTRLQGGAQNCQTFTHVQRTKIRPVGLRFSVYLPARYAIARTVGSPFLCRQNSAEQNRQQSEYRFNAQNPHWKRGLECGSECLFLGPVRKWYPFRCGPTWLEFLPGARQTASAKSCS